MNRNLPRSTYLKAALQTPMLLAAGAVVIAGCVALSAAAGGRYALTCWWSFINAPDSCGCGCEWDDDPDYDF